MPLLGRSYLNDSPATTSKRRLGFGIGNFVFQTSSFTSKPGLGFRVFRIMFIGRGFGLRLRFVEDVLGVRFHIA